MNNTKYNYLEAKHSLDSDEEDTINAYNILNIYDIEGEEDGVARHENGIRITAFNIREEMDEGYFDKNRYFVWNKKTEIKDNWLDNIDIYRIKHLPNEERRALTLGNNNDDEKYSTPFNEMQCYKEILGFMEPNETINDALRRLGGRNKNLSSVNRLKMKKAGLLLNTNNEKITRLTELANEILCRRGNSDIYQETFEIIHKKVLDLESK